MPKPSSVPATFSAAFRHHQALHVYVSYDSIPAYNLYKAGSGFSFRTYDLYSTYTYEKHVRLDMCIHVHQDTILHQQ